VVVCGAILLGGCFGQQTTGGEHGEGHANLSDPDARSFSGTIVSLRLLTSTMLIAKEERMGKDLFPNQVVVKWDAQTKFLMDGEPTTLDKIQQYMTVKIQGHMREGQMFAEVADFSSVLPKGVKPAAG